LLVLAAIERRREYVKQPHSQIVLLQDAQKLLEMKGHHGWLPLISRLNLHRPNHHRRPL
jgi:hypothetical protein